MKHFKVTLVIISISILCYHIFKLFYLWADIPERIAIHFTNDTPDNWGPKYILYIMPILGIFFWFLMGLLVKKPEKMNYINLTGANKEIQFSRTSKVMILIQNISFLSFILANEALLRYSVGIDSSLPFIISLTLLAICCIAPIYLLIWASTLKY
ncbi:DUF1648 domain-containing protein [Niallia circulans]|uniref:DUF1648 domain-containing protein n=1 Tax=Niallia circulans TaxID=1397 RepID=UPI001595D501